MPVVPQLLIFTDHQRGKSPCQGKRYVRQIYLNYSFSFHLITKNMYLWRLGELERDGCNLRSGHQVILFPRGVNFIQSEKESTIVGLSNLWNLNNLLFDWNHKIFVKKRSFFKMHRVYVPCLLLHHWTQTCFLHYQQEFCRS